MSALRAIVVPRPRFGRNGVLLSALVIVVVVRAGDDAVRDMVVLRGATVVLVREDTDFVPEMVVLRGITDVTPATRGVVFVSDWLRSRAPVPVFALSVLRDAVVRVSPDLVVGVVFCRFVETVVAVVPRRVAARAMSDASSANAA